MRAVPFLLVTVLLAASCSRSQPSDVVPAPAPAPSPAPVAAVQPPQDDCTLATPLTPGIPGSPGHLLPSDINPNGASELAALMRTMQKELTAAREAILAGQPAPGPLFPTFRKMRCTWPTAPADRNQKYDDLAVTYLALVKAYDAKPPDARAAYDGVLTGCRACHDQTCAGPIEVIEGLRLPRP